MTTLAAAPADQRRIVTWLRESTVPYLASLMITLMASGWANYLQPLVLPEDFAIKGQSLAIVIALLGFPISLGLWLACRARRTSNVWLTAVIAGLAVSWVAHMVLLKYHGDLHTHAAWLFVPVLAMLLLKTPSSHETWQVLNVFAWSAVTILIATRLLEMFGAVPVYPIAQSLIDWEKERYWLPFSGYLGVDGRWPGPFGYNSKTGFISTLLVLIGVARWQRLTSAVFISVGVLGVLLTGGRGAAFAMFAGLFVLLAFATWGPISRIPMAIRATTAAIAFVGVGLAFLASPLSTTGRLGSGGIWDAFITLWKTSPWLGVGQTGIMADERTGVLLEAHNVFVQELTRSGVVGFAFHFAAITVGLGLAAVAAYRGLAWPLALVVAYYVASLTEVFQDGWLHHSTYSLLIIMSFTASGQWISEHLKPQAAQTSPPEASASVDLFPA